MATERNNINPCTSGVRGKKRSNFHRSNSWRKRGKLVNPNISQPAIPSASYTSNSFQRDELFTAPTSTDSNQLQVFPINNPSQYPAWRLYFHTEMFIESSALVQKIKAFEHHIAKNPEVYVLEQIRERQWFFVNKDTVARDSDFNTSWRDFVRQLQENPKLVLSCIGLAMYQVIFKITTPAESHHNKRLRKIDARPVDFFPAISITEISPEKHDRLLKVHGRIVWMSAVETKCTWVAYRCKRCNHEQAIRQDIYPTKPLRCRIQCNSKRNFKELRSSPYTKVEWVQTLELQESGLGLGIDSSNGIEIELRGDLIDIVCPGNEITVTGILKYKSLARNQDNRKQRERAAYIQAVTVVNRTQSGKVCKKATEKDLEIVEMISKEPNSLRLLVQSLAPDICGYEAIKFAVLLSQFGGFGSQLHNEGELHILMVGDPGLGKSNLLQHAARISEIGKSHTHFMSTLQHTNRVLCSRTSSLLETSPAFAFHSGQCCIDDMDKLSSSQETLIQIMQTRSMATRSPNVAFNTAAKKSILAAVNPTGGHYDSSKLLRENVRLKPSLLALFHFVFVLYDEVSKARDNLLSEHVKAMHSGMKKVLTIPKKYSSKTGDAAEVPLDDDEDVDLVDRLKVNFDEQLDLLPPILLKKYIEYAQQTFKPLLAKEAAEDIKEFYLSLRSEKRETDFSITTRQLEGLIRFTQARARAELSTVATRKHANDVIELVRNSYNQTPITSRLDSTLNGSIVGKAGGSQVKKFIQMVQMRSNVLGRRIFEFEELTDMASHAGIKCGVTNIVETMNMQGYLIKKGPKLYEVTLTS